MTKMTKLEWDALVAGVMDEYLKVDTKVASRGEEVLEGYIIEVDYELDDTDYCYCIDWGHDRVEWCRREEFYVTADEDAKELINPQTDKQYSQSRYPEEAGWQRYGWTLHKIAQYQKAYYGKYDKILYKQHGLVKNTSVKAR